MSRLLGLRRGRLTRTLAGLFILSVGFVGSFVLWFWLVLSPVQKQDFSTYMAAEMTGTLSNAASFISLH